MSQEAHVRFCEGVGVRLPRATHLIITGASRELQEEEVHPLVEAFLKERGFILSPEMTRIMHIEVGLDFLERHLRYVLDSSIKTV